MLALYVLLAPTIILFCGLAIDVGLLEMKTVEMQKAADAAAVGAQISHDREDSTWVTQGQNDASVNGFTNGTNGVTVTISEQPRYGSYSNDYDAIQATVEQQVQTIFMGKLNGGKVNLSATATSLMTPCVYATSAANLTTYSIQIASNGISGSSLGYWGGSTMGCTVYAGKSVVVDALSSLWANAVNVAGGAASSTIVNAFHSPRFNAASMSDPLATTIAQPVLGSCTYTTAYNVNNTTATLNPGTYCGGLNISNSTVTLNAGLYIIAGGASWNNSTVTGTGVTLFFTKYSTGGYGQFIVFDSTMEITAPATSSNNSIPAILVMSDRNWVHTAAQDFQFLNSYVYGDGIYYTTGTGIEVSASTFGGTHYFALDTDNLLISTSNVSGLSNFSSVPSGNPFRPMGGLVQ